MDEDQIKLLIIKEIKKLEAELRQSLEDAISEAIKSALVSVNETLAESFE